MKIAVSANGKNLRDRVSEVFARCPYFVIADVQKGEIRALQTIKNESQQQKGRAGISVAQLMAEKNIEAVITKNIGPRAFEVLHQFHIKVFSADGEIKQVLKDFMEEKLEEFFK